MRGLTNTDTDAYASARRQDAAFFIAAPDRQAISSDDPDRHTEARILTHPVSTQYSACTELRFEKNSKATTESSAVRD